MIDHFYKCFGCERRHENGAAALLCCAVMQEIWQCSRCDEQFATAAKAERHELKCRQTSAPPPEMCGTGQSFAAGSFDSLSLVSCQ